MKSLAATMRNGISAFADSDFWPLLLVLSVGIFFRFYHLASVPPGLWYDEAFYANKAMEFLNGHPHLIYYQRDEAQTGLFPSLLAIGFWLMGDTLAAPRAVMAAWGVLGLVGCYGLSLELFHAHSQKRAISLLATALLATSYWHLNFSRLIFSASLVPSFEIFSLWFTLHAFRTGNLKMAAAAGAITALGLYSYWQYYSFALIPAVLALHYLYLQPRRHLKIFCLYSGAGILTFMPLAAAFFEHPALGRIGHIFIFANQPGTSLVYLLYEFFGHVCLHINMLFTEGDRNWRHNLSGQAELSPLAAAGLLCAFYYFPFPRFRKQSLSKTQSPEEKPLPLPLLLGWVLLALLPAALTNEGLPHASRAIGMVAPLQILSAFGIISAWNYFKARFSLASSVGTALLICALTAQSLATAHEYFVVFAQSPEARKYFSLFDPALLQHHFTCEAQHIDQDKIGPPVFTIFSNCDKKAWFR